MRQLTGTRRVEETERRMNMSGTKGRTKPNQEGITSTRTATGSSESSGDIGAVDTNMKMER
jgi:hypothetical protein